ncbi:Fc.00g087110.m01.CDS01 [Cosmosporella sp. VM-42]
MRGLVKAAALLLAPALAGASLFGLDETVPAAFVTLEIPLGKNQAETLTLRLDVQESEQICGYANVTVNSQTLSQDANGSGRGHLNVDNGAFIEAAWRFTCIGDEKNPFEQLMTFTVQSMDGEPVPEASFSASFRQTFPVVISDIAGAAYVYRLSIPIPAESVDNVEADEEGTSPKEAFPKQPAHEKPDQEVELQAKMQELDLLHAQVQKLHQIIYMKEMAIYEQFASEEAATPSPTFNLRECDNVQCVVRGLAQKVKHKAGEWCGDMGGIFGGWGKGGKGHGPHHGPPHGHHPPGNGSWPHPPHGRPPMCPPCDRHHGRPHGPHHPPPWHHGPPPPPPPPGHGEGPPPPPHHGERPPPPPGHHGGPPMDRPHHGDGPDHDRFDVPDSHMNGDEQPMVPEQDGPHGPPPHHKHGPGGHHHPHPPLPHQNLIIAVGMAAIAFGIFSLLGIGYIHRRVVRLTPEGRRALRRLRHLSREERRARRHNRKAAIKAFFRRMFLRWTDDEEKQAMLEGRQRTRRDSGDDDITMEQEIAQFRQAAFMVEGMVAAEEGRSQPEAPLRDVPLRDVPLREMPQQRPSQPPVVPQHVQSLYPGYIVSDERLPSYDDETVDSSVVSDGCRYTPGSSDYTPSTSGSNADNVLGDSKH